MYRVRDKTSIIKANKKLIKGYKNTKLLLTNGTSRTLLWCSCWLPTPTPPSCPQTPGSRTRLRTCGSWEPPWRSQRGSLPPHQSRRAKTLQKTWCQSRSVPHPEQQRSRRRRTSSRGTRGGHEPQTSWSEEAKEPSYQEEGSSSRFSLWITAEQRN